MEICLKGTGHMTKMAALSIYAKNPSEIFSRTGGPQVDHRWISTKLGM